MLQLSVGDQLDGRQASEPRGRVLSQLVGPVARCDFSDYRGLLSRAKLAVLKAEDQHANYSSISTHKPA